MLVGNFRKQKEIFANYGKTKTQGLEKELDILGEPQKARSDDIQKLSEEMSEENLVS